MTNADFSLEDFVDIELKGNYDYFVKELKSISEADFLKAARKVSRDHARTPMQWNDKKMLVFQKLTHGLR
ncbi:hypothetical protein [Aerococcus sp. Group 1]|uniref:hypothetical protein n=1 Tax=Aerococcus urinae (strain CCUG 59500 / ACS-120-V-Col10a) TaxID=2976812 RepID=UPI0002DC41F4|nr:hypothetical protein [Aerococcus sp. Group 1]